MDPAERSGLSDRLHVGGALLGERAGSAIFEAALSATGRRWAEREHRGQDDLGPASFEWQVVSLRRGAASGTLEPALQRSVAPLEAFRRFAIDDGATALLGVSCASLCNFFGNSALQQGISARSSNKKASKTAGSLTETWSFEACHAGGREFESRRPPQRAERAAVFLIRLQKVTKNVTFRR
jgi:hypothetical protein